LEDIMKNWTLELGDSADPKWLAEKLKELLNDWGVIAEATGGNTSHYDTLRHLVYKLSHAVPQAEPEPEIKVGDFVQRTQEYADLEWDGNRGLMKVVGEDVSRYARGESFERWKVQYGPTKREVSIAKNLVEPVDVIVTPAVAAQPEVWTVKH
jgi:hypothetical protein